jgi:hypothetical protein
VVNGKLSWDGFVDAAQASISQGIEAWAAEAQISGRAVPRRASAGIVFEGLTPSAVGTIESSRTYIAP